MNQVRVSIIVASDEKRGIGKNNDLLFKIPRDIKRFREKTEGHPIIMGRKTFESLNRPNGLPNRTNIVLTKQNLYNVIKNDEKKSVLVYQDWENALAEAKRIAQQSHVDEIFIIGGGEIFRQAIDKGLVDRLYLTIVKGNYEADTFFLEYKSIFTKEINPPKTYTEDGYTFTFLDLEK